MPNLMISVAATILGISIVQLANGFLGTHVSMSTASAGFGPITAGIVLASYFAGYTIGAASIGPVLKRVGHIRVFAALAGIVAAAVVLMPVFTSGPAWIVMRVLTGFGCAGLFVTAESWLNGTADSSNRGSIFAIYMVATNLAFGGGQFLINLPFPGRFELFSLAAALFCLALIPVSLTRSTPPAIPDTPRLRLRDLRRVAPVAIAGCVASGLVGSAFYAVVPAYAQAQGIASGTISAYIATAIFGGLAFQVPMGKLSDRMDRRHVAAGIAIGLALACGALMALPPSRAVAFGVTFLLGGFMSTIYPVCVAHANDRVTPDKVVAVSGQLILINGFASFLGPMLGSALTAALGIEALFAMIALVALGFAALALWRSANIRAPRHRERPFTFLSDNMSQPIGHVAEDADALEDLPSPQDLR